MLRHRQYQQNVAAVNRYIYIYICFATGNTSKMSQQLTGVYIYIYMLRHRQYQQNGIAFDRLYICFVAGNASKTLQQTGYMLCHRQCQ